MALTAKASVALTLPAPWYPRTAVVALEVLESAKGKPLQAVAGPRATRVLDGAHVEGARVILALLEVEPQPLQLEIPRVSNQDVMAAPDRPAGTEPATLVDAASEGDGASTH